MKVALFITCLSDTFFPAVGMDVVKVLEHFGCGVEFPEAQTCCGQPHYNNGYHHDARQLAKRMIEVFEPYPYVVTPSGSCAAMIREQYPKLFEADAPWLASANALAEKTYEFGEFLTKVLQVDLSGYRLPVPVTLAYHYNCHTRGLHVTPQAVPQLLGQLGNVTFVPLEKAEQCCGFGGTFSTKYPDISRAMVKDKIKCGAQSGADAMVVNDGGCAMNIAGACHRYGEKFTVTHMATLIAQALATPKAEAKP